MFHVKRVLGQMTRLWTQPRPRADTSESALKIPVESMDMVEQTATDADSGADKMSVDANVLDDIRGRIVPMFEVAAEKYRNRVPEGYPNVIDQPARGSLGLQIDPSFALYLTAEGEAVYAEIYRRVPRTDARTGSGRQRPAGVPFNDRRLLDPSISDQGLRNLIAELMSYFNQQPGLIHITDD